MGKECKSSRILHFQGSERFIDVLMGGKQRIRCLEINSMFRTEAQFLVSTSHGLNYMVRLIEGKII